MERFLMNFKGVISTGIMVLTLLPFLSCLQPGVSAPQNPVSCTPVLVAKPDRLTFKVPATPNAVSEQTISVVNKGTGDLNWVISDDSSWITLQQLTGTSNSQGTDAKVMIDVTGMSPGNYTGIVTIASEGALNSPVYVPVSLSIMSQTLPGQTPVVQPPQTMAPSPTIPTPGVSSATVPPANAVYWNSKNDLYRYANSSACVVSGSIQNLDKVWYMGDVQVVTGSGPSAYITDVIPPGEQVIYNRYIPCSDRENIRLSYKWFK
jgi:hypothetical protein